MIGRPPRSTRTDTLFPSTALFRSIALQRQHLVPQDGKLGLAIAEPVDIAPDPGLQLRSLFPPACQLRPPCGDFTLAGAQRIRLRRVPVIQPAHLSAHLLLQVGAGCVYPRTPATTARSPVPPARGATLAAPAPSITQRLHNGWPS